MILDWQQTTTYQSSNAFTWPSFSITGVVTFVIAHCGEFLSTTLTASLVDATLVASALITNITASNNDTNIAKSMTKTVIIQPDPTDSDCC